MKIKAVKRFQVLLVLSSVSTLISIEAPKCRKDQFQCKDLACIPKDWVCDKDYDCQDHSDESHCNKTYCHPHDDFKCSNGKCISKSWRCDGQIDCSFDGSDKSDEKQCPVTKCYASQFKCRNSRECIPLAWRCDSEIDCKDESDEIGCDSKCSDREFSCNNGRCIDQLWRCDFENDCGDRSDEEGCPKVNTNCSARQFQCSNKFCIPANWVCDGDKDCRDESDEKVLTCKEQIKCDSHHFKCKSPSILSTCILMSMRCNGVRDCIDGSDEEDCPSFTCHPGKQNCSTGSGSILSKNTEKKVDFSQKDCYSNQFKCGDTPLHCIKISQVCDGKKDCADGADEQDNCNVNECTEKKNFCSQKCIDHKIGYQCDCLQGFELDSNGYTCNDINECETFGQCSHYCINTKGSFKCLCAGGYQLVNKTYCKVKGEKMFFMFPEKSTIRFLKYEKTLHLHSVVADLNGAVGLTFNVNENYLYWSDMKEKSILRTNIFDSHRKEELIVSNLGSTEGLAVDWLAKNLYWVDSKKHIIEVSNLEGKYRTLLCSTGENQPRNLVIDPREGHRYLYYSSWGESAHIWRVSMDGANSTKTVFYHRAGSWPNCLAMDFVSNTLYWIDPKRSTIESLSLLNSTQHRIVFKTRANHIYGLAVFEDFVYWTDWSDGAIHKVNKLKGGKDTHLIKHLYRPMAIVVYHLMLQPAAPNPCARAHCSHLCLLSSEKKGFRCACENGVQLFKDGITCIVNDSSPCREDYCLSGGTCHPKKSGNTLVPSCICTKEYKGQRCEKKAEPLRPVYRNGLVVQYQCMPGFCLNGGTCYETFKNKTLFRPHCVCKRTFYGKRCTHYTDLFDKTPSNERPGFLSDGRTTGTVVGFGVGIVSACGVFAGMAYYLQHKSSTRVYRNPRYRGTATSEDDAQLHTLNEEINSETIT